MVHFCSIYLKIGIRMWYFLGQTRRDSGGSTAFYKVPSNTLVEIRTQNRVFTQTMSGLFFAEEITFNTESLVGTVFADLPNTFSPEFVKIDPTYLPLPLPANAIVRYGTTPYTNYIEKQVTTGSIDGNLNTYFGIGTSSYLSVAGHSDFNFQENSFVIQFYINFISPTAADIGVVMTNKQLSENTNENYWVFSHSNNILEFKIISNQYANGFTTYSLSTSKLLFNKWYHVAVLRFETDLCLLIDGLIVARSVIPISLNVGSDATPKSLTIGNFATLERALNAYLDEIVITKNQDIIDTNLVKSTVDEITTSHPNHNQVLLLLNLNDFIDRSNSPKTITPVNSPVIDNSIKKFSSGSLYLNGASSQYLDVSVGNFNTNSTEFTIEFWIRPGVYDSITRCIIDIVNSFYASIINITLINQTIYVNGSTLANIPDFSYSPNHWHHLSFAFKSGKIIFKVNGRNYFITSLACTLNNITSITIGARRGGPTQYLNFFSGHLDDFVISNNAKYLESVPTNAFGISDSDYSSSVLILNSEETNNSTNIIDISPNPLQILKFGTVKFTNSAAQFGSTSIDFTIPDPFWLSFEFPSSIILKSFKFMPSGSYPNSFNLEYSNDNISWTFVESLTNLSGTLNEMSQSYSLNPSNISAKYWRFTNLTLNTANNLSLRVLEFYNENNTRLPVITGRSNYRSAETDFTPFEDAQGTVYSSLTRLFNSNNTTPVSWYQSAVLGTAPSDSYLKVLHDSKLNLGSNLKIEFWFNCATPITNQVGYSTNSSYALVTKAGSFRIIVDDNRLAITLGATSVTIYSFQMTANTWNHLLVAITNGSLIISLNGIPLASDTSARYFNSSSPLYIGASAVSSGGSHPPNALKFYGRIDGLKISSSSQIFSIPTTEYNNSNPNHSLILHMNGTNDSTTFVDSSANPKTVTVSGLVKIVTEESKLGNSSARFIETNVNPTRYLFLKINQNSVGNIRESLVKYNLQIPNISIQPRLMFRNFYSFLTQLPAVNLNTEIYLDNKFYKIQLPAISLNTANYLNNEFYKLNLNPVNPVGKTYPRNLIFYIEDSQNLVSAGSNEIVGYVRDKLNNPCSRQVVAFQRSTFKILDKTFSNVTTGYFKLKVINTECIVICLPLDVDDVNAEIYDKIMPLDLPEDPPVTILPGLGGLTNKSITDSNIPYTTNNQTFAQAYISLSSNGTWTLANNSQGIIETGNFSNPTGTNIVENLYVKFTRISYTNATGTTLIDNSDGTTNWLPLTASPRFVSITLQSTAACNNSAVYTIEISSDPVGGNILGTATGVTMNGIIA